MPENEVDVIQNHHVFVDENKEINFSDLIIQLKDLGFPLEYQAIQYH